MRRFIDKLISYYDDFKDWLLDLTPLGLALLGAALVLLAAFVAAPVFMMLAGLPLVGGLFIVPAFAAHWMAASFTIGVLVCQVPFRHPLFYVPSLTAVLVVFFIELLK